MEKNSRILESAKAQADANGACRESVRQGVAFLGRVFFGPISWDLRPPKKTKINGGLEDDVLCFFSH